MKYFDAFSGYGGFSLGIGDIGECVGFSEVNKYAIQVYSKHFPTHTNYGDISKIDWAKVPDFDLLTGGSPCQDFSIAGKREGIVGERSGLVWEYIRCLKEKKPRYFIWENVKGVMSSRKGFDFANILTAFSEAGYDLQWQVLNAKDFGVPQNRERIFIVGSRGEPRPEVFPIGTGNEVDTQPDGQGNAYCLQAGGDKYRGTYINQLNNPTHSNNRLYGEDGLSPALNTAQGGNRQPKIYDDYNHRMRTDGNVGTVRATFANEATGNGNKVVVPVLTPDRPEKRQNGRRFKEDGEPSFTLTAQDKHGIYDGMKIRRLTPLECERLMGLPDGWTEGVSDTQRYKLCGNGVVVNVVKEIIKRL